MTALNVMFGPGAVHVFTDGTSYHQDGCPDAPVQKVAILAHLNCVIASRGPTLFLPSLAAGLGSSCKTFDDLVDGIGESARETFRRFRRELRVRGQAGNAAGSVCQVVVAGWSTETGKPEAYQTFSHETDGFRGGTVHAIENGLVSPADDELFVRLDQIGWDHSAADVVQEGRRLMNEQRRRMWPGPKGNLFTAVGGFCQVTSVTREGISTRILERWPDGVSLPC